MTTVGPLTHLHWHHPEWVAYVVVEAGWLALVAPLLNNPPRLLRSDHHGSVAMVVGAVIMPCAMMAPLVVDRVHDVAVSSLWARRYRAVIGYLAGYLAVWSVATLVMMAGVHLLRMAIGALSVVVCSGVVAVAVASAHDHRRRLARCFASRPFALTGWRADRDCIVDGMRMAGRCAATSWALMLLMIGQGGLVVMVVGTAVLVQERRQVLTRRSAAQWTVAVVVIAVLLTVPGLGSLVRPETPHLGH